jgi:hypothetical protein
MSAFEAVISTVAAVATVIGLPVAFLALRRTPNGKYSPKQTAATFRQVRRELKSVYDRGRLESVANKAQRKYLLVEDVPLLVKPGWIAEAPLRLDAVRPDWKTPEKAKQDADFEPALEFASRCLAGSGQLGNTYHKVIKLLERPDERLFFNGSSFRLLDVAVGQDSESPEKFPVTLTFTAGWYFDALDTTDVLGYETAALGLGPRRLDHWRKMRGPYRRWLGDPFNLQKRCAIPGVNTLTIRLGEPAPTFILHERNLQNATSQGVTHVAPAGEFQPRDQSTLASIVDLDLWNNITREYAEELLGLNEARDQPHGLRLNARLDEVASALDDARARRDIDVWYLGVGLDPLTWKPEILTVAVFKPEVFDTIFRDIVTENDEGKLMFPDEGSTRMTPFTEDNVKPSFRDRLLPAGAACLELAWRYRGEMGIRD